MLAIAAVAAAAVVLFALPLAFVVARNYRDDELLRLQRDTIAATRAIDVDPRRHDPIELPSSTDRLAVYEASGRRVAGTGGPVHADTLVDAALRASAPVSESDSQLVVVVPLLSGERVTGALRAQRSGDATADAVRRAWLALAGLALLVVLLAVLAAFVLGRRLARPLERLAVAARRLGQGDFATRAPRGGVPEADQIAIALDETAQRLADLVARERAFSADASHQLRTPLAALRIELEALEMSPDAPAELPRALAQVERLQSTIDTLLAVARDIPRPAADTDVADVVDELQARWRDPLAAEARPLRIGLSPEAGTSSASGAVVSEILDVLLENAQRHGAGAVSISTRSSGRWIALDVADEGPGFSGTSEEVFTRRAPSPDGHGIGLSLAQSLAHAEGGRLAVTQLSPPVITLWLPAAADGVAAGT
ncbi:HAMP domain-containing sensor histidine kinase [Solirubrobacter soli]|uniref:HAMP domain-containing sensor histidine kinase n=1 Tax=Solirubrobacter soli TaxID=363832 RepID=UPI00146D2B71|nr:HAMP domain-containing sensor histidine kinase [Solirubrobacter soli]